MVDSPEGRPFQVVETDEFLAKVEKAVGSIRRWDEVRWSLGWMLEIAPNLGQYLPTYDIWAVTLHCDPPLVVYYDIDERNRTVTLLDLMVMET